MALANVLQASVDLSPVLLIGAHLRFEGNLQLLCRHQPGKILGQVFWLFGHPEVWASYSGVLTPCGDLENQRGAIRDIGVPSDSNSSASTSRGHMHSGFTYIRSTYPSRSSFSNAYIKDILIIGRGGARSEFTPADKLSDSDLPVQIEEDGSLSV